MKLSIIIPALNEAASLPGLLRNLSPPPPGTEVLVVDGGSEDATPTLVSPPFRLLRSARGRARQMNHGAGEALGEWLLFLHADTLLTDGFAGEITGAAERGFRAGVFRLAITGAHPLLRVSEWGANWRTRWRKIFLGDQALFIRRDLFMDLGGFPDLPLMEDYAFALTLKKRKEPLWLSPLSVTTSGRRWERRGYLRTWWLMRRVFYRYHRTGSAEQAAALYRDVR